MSSTDELFSDIRDGKREGLEQWLDGGGNVNAAREGNEETLIMQAAMEGHAELVKMLLNAGADLQARDSRGRIPAHYAGRSADEATVRLFLEHGYGVNDDVSGNDATTTFLDLVAFSDTPGLVRYLIERGANVNAGADAGSTALMHAAGAGHAAVVDILMRAGADVTVTDAFGNSALTRAAYAGHTAICGVLLDAGLDVNARTRRRKSALDLAAGEGHEETCLFLMERGATPDGEALLKAAEEGLVSLLDRIIKQQPELIGYRGWLAYTPLIMAAKRGTVEMLRRLLEAGADIDEQDDNKGWTPLMHACYRQEDELIEFLKKAGADEDIKDKSGKTAFDLTDDFYDYDD